MDRLRGKNRVLRSCGFSIANPKCAMRQIDYLRATSPDDSFVIDAISLLDNGILAAIIPGAHPTIWNEPRDAFTCTLERYVLVKAASVE